ncbi:NAD(P)/FAD-dependent oxidoreductase [Mycobacterium pyrenivorans]|nr:NAD(P)/FAD-dependent oxidoreductase [Mycolicibacterium pyrenivorans]
MGFIEEGATVVNADTAVANVNQSSGETDFDVVVIGAGFAGLYALHRCREMGFRTVSLEKADSVGGTWLFNRYPGARCDIESIEYSYSFSEEIQQEWVWTENMPAQPEIEAYLNFVADRLDLRRDIKFTTHVVAMQFSDTDAAWTIRTEGGEIFTAGFVIAASGILSVPLEPTIEGMESFGGESLFTNRWPRDKVSFANKRVGIIGTGSTGVQAIPVVAREAAHLTVFQRSPAYTLPWEVRSLDDGELDEMKARYPEIRAAQREHFVGAARLTAFSFMLGMMERPRLLATSEEERQRAVEDDGVKGALNWSDVFTDMEANDLARRLYGRAIARIVTNPDTAASLVPSHAFGCKRPIIDQGYYETYNRDNVTLVDLRKGALKRVIPTGIETEQGTYDIDVIIFATGFDAMTGALTKMDIRGRLGQSLRDRWSSDGAGSYLGLAVAGFPNMFVVQAPGSPAPSSNYIAVMEANVEWITDCLAHLRHRGHRTIEATAQAQQEWMEHTTSMVKGSLFTHPSCNSWYNGGNVAGKKKMYMGYIAGVPEYRRRCDVAAANGYAGFDIDSAPST